MGVVALLENARETNDSGVMLDRMAARCAACQKLLPYALCARHQADRRAIGAQGIALCRAALRDAHNRAQQEELNDGST